MVSRTSEKQQLVTNAKHSNPFYISVHALCHNKRLKQKRNKIFEQFRNQSNKSSKTDYKRRKIPNSVTAAVTIDLISDDEDDGVHNTPNTQTNVSSFDTSSFEMLNSSQVKQYAVKRDITSEALINNSGISISRKKLKMPHQWQSGKDHAIRLISNESIVLSDDSNSDQDVNVEDVTTTTAKQDFAQQNSIQVDEVTVSLIPRPVNSSNTHKSVFLSPISQPFPMLPDETTVQTVIANRTYELPLTKLREGLASCGIPEFAQDPQQIAMQRRKYGINPPIVTPPQQPISLKLSSDLSISLISDDDDDDNDNNDESNLNTDSILNPALLQKLPLNISIAPANIGLATPKRKLG